MVTRLADQRTTDFILWRVENMTLNTEPWLETCAAEQDLELKFPSKLTENTVMTMPVGGITKKQRRELRVKLKEDLITLQSLSLKLEARELELRQSLSSQMQTNGSDTQLSGNDTRTPGDKEVSSQINFSSPKLAQRVVGLTKQESFRSNESTASTIISGKRTPKANPLYNRADFVVGKDKMPLSIKSRSKHAKKRKGSVSGNEVNYKQTVTGIPTDIRLHCKSVLSKLMSHKNGWIFNRPVDAAKLELADYHSIITKPMDLGTIRAKLDKKQFSTAQDFANDVRLTFNNAMTYNPPSNEVHIMAEELLSIFENGWKAIAEKLEKLEAEAELDVETIQVQDAGSVGTKPKTAAQKSKAKSQKRVMTLENKVELQKILEQLPQQMLEGIINLMKEKNVNMCEKGDEIEVDLDSFDDDALWKLDRHVRNCLKRLNQSRKKVPKKPQVATSAPPSINRIEKDERGSVPSSSGSSSSESSSSSDSDSASSGSDMDSI